MYDYVLSAGDPPGCVLACAGWSEDPESRLPGGGRSGRHGGRDPHPGDGAHALSHGVDGDYDSHEEPHLAGAGFFLPAGSVLGGSSSLNGMSTPAAPRRPYDAWNQPGWSFADMLPIFPQGPEGQPSAAPSRFHGAGGPSRCPTAASTHPDAARRSRGRDPGRAIGNDGTSTARPRRGSSASTGDRSARAAACSTPSRICTLRCPGPNLPSRANVQGHGCGWRERSGAGVVGDRLGEEIHADGPSAHGSSCPRRIQLPAVRWLWASGTGRGHIWRRSASRWRSTSR